MPVRLSAGAFDLCLTAGPGEDVSVGSCGRLISPPLTQAQLVDSTLWDSARKLSGPPSDKSPERIPRWLSQALAPVACFSLFAYSELQRGNDFIAVRHTGAFFDKCFDYPELWVTGKESL